MKKSIVLFLFVFQSVAVWAVEPALIGARQQSLGGTGLTLADVWSAQYNPAAIAQLEGIDVGLAYQNRWLLPETGAQAGYIASKVRNGGIVLSLNSFGFDAYSENRVGLNYAMALSGSLRIGIGMNYYQVRFTDFYGTQDQVTASFGFQADLSSKISIAGSATNLTRAAIDDFDDERIATVLYVGGRYDFEDNLRVLAELHKDIDRPLAFKSGLEYDAGEKVVLRCGIGVGPLSNAFGIGFKLSSLRIDAGSAWHPTLGFLPTVGINWSRTYAKPKPAQSIEE